MPLGQSNVNDTPASFADPLESVEDVPSSCDNHIAQIKPSKWLKVKAANRHIASRSSRGEIKLCDIINELQQFAAAKPEDDIHKDEQITENYPWNYLRLFRRRLAHFLRTSIFHYLVILLVITDLIIVLLDLVLAQLSSPCLTKDEFIQYNTTVQRDTCLLEYSVHLIRADLFLFYFSLLLLSFFVFEVFISLYAFGWKYYKNPLYLIDGTIVCVSFVMEIYFHYGNIGRAGRAAAAIVILRLWKIIRAIHAVAHSITLKNHLMIKKIQEAQVTLEEEKQQTEQTLAKQEIRMEYLMNILTKMGKLPSTKQIENYVNEQWKERNKLN